MHAAMKRLGMAAIWLLITTPLGAKPLERRVPWDSRPPLVEVALHAFRQGDHWVAQLMARNFDGDALGRDTDARPSLNFDPSRHLYFIQHDLNGDGRPEVFLLFNWPVVRGNQQATGVVMVETEVVGVPFTRTQWRIGCEFSDLGDEGPRGGIRVLDAPSHGWRNFRTSDAVYAWRPVAGEAAIMECIPTSPVPSPRQGRAAP
jgi:hypothetical protein